MMVQVTIFAIALADKQLRRKGRTFVDLIQPQLT